MGKKDSGADEAAKARQDEEQRQARIRAGTKRVNSIFDGSYTGTDPLGAGSAYDPSAQYYNADGTLWSPGRAVPRAGTGGSDRFWALNNQTGEYGWMGGSSGKPTVSGNSAERQFREAVASGKLFSGTKSTGGFNDDFFKSRRQAFIDYATPQLEDQYGSAQKELTYSLARGGNLNSSARGEKLGELQKLYDINKQNVADQALSYETQARTSVEDARANLITTLNATGDAEGAANSALARSTALSQPAAYSPLSQLFSDFTNTLGMQAAQERSAAASGGAYKPNYNTGLFGNTGRVVNR